MKIGKEKGKREKGKGKKEKVSWLAGPGGNFHPASALARATTRAAGPTRPANGSGAVGAGPRASEGEGKWR
jgi:hypothetical protein